MVARPSDGRPVEAVLRGAGYEVHRTPTDGDLEALVLALRPHLVMMALNLPWVDAASAIQGLMDGAWSGSILLLDVAETDSAIEGFPRLPLNVEPAPLLEAIEQLIVFGSADPDE